MSFAKSAAKAVLPIEAQKAISRRLRARRRTPKAREAAWTIADRPDWLLPAAASARPQDRDAADRQEGAGGIALWFDVASAAHPALDDPALVRPLRLHARDDARVASDFAAAHPDVVLEVVVEHARAAAEAGARWAILVDLDDPLVQLFARACQEVGLTRIHLPPRRLSLSGPWDDEGAAGAHGRPSPHAVRAARFSDHALVWLRSHRDGFRAAGLPEAALHPIAPPDLPAPTAVRAIGGPARILVRLERPTLWLGNGAKAHLRALVDAVAGIALATGVEVDLVLPASLRRGLRLTDYERLRAEPAVRMMRPPHPADDGAHRLDGVDLLVTDASGLAARAARRGIPSVDAAAGLAHHLAEGSPAAFARDVGHVAMAGLDGGRGGPALEIPTGGGTLIAALDRIGADPARRADVQTGLFAGRTWAHAKIVSTLDDERLRGTHRFVPALLGVRALTRVDRATPAAEMADADVFLAWGLRDTAEKRHLRRACAAMRARPLLLEDGFVRSVGIGLQGSPTCSVVMDDRTLFYDATRPSRLETMLQGDAAFDADALARAERAMALIVRTKVSKYNFAPDVTAPRPAPPRKTVLVVDQRAGDVSIEMGLASQASFDAMMDAALSVSDDHDVVVKTHPDATIGGRESAIGAARLRAAAKRPHVRIVTDSTNPYSLIDVADKVFVVTSGMGFEALMAGREVWCFGMPFYAGWGLTRDRVVLPRRSRRRTLPEVFHAFYIALSRYVDPTTGEACELEDLVHAMVATRPWSLDAAAGPASDDAPRRAAAPAPVPAPAPPLPTGAPPARALRDFDVLLAVGFSRRKQGFYRRIFPDHDLRFLPFLADIRQVMAALEPSPRLAILQWGLAPVPGLARAAHRRGVPVVQVEDGFLRHVESGALRQAVGDGWIPPYSVCLDRRGLYYDARNPSDLEALLATHDFAADPDLMARAARGRAAIVRHGLSKYNFATPPRPEPFGPKAAPRVLVIGQVEDDASIHFGAPGATNNDLVRLARRENPDAQVIYKVHPDVMAGLRPALSDPAEVAGICDLHAAPLAARDAFDGVDRVYVTTSLMGFEALMRDVAVTVAGRPFYAGWGLTDDRAPIPRRDRRLTIDQLFAAAYLLYSSYVDPRDGSPLSLERVIERIRAERDAAP